MQIQSFRLIGSECIEEISCHRASEQDVVYWEDIEQVFPGIKQVKSGKLTISLLRNSDGERLVPHCIKYCPDVVLDVVLLPHHDYMYGRSSTPTSSPHAAFSRTHTLVPTSADKVFPESDKKDFAPRPPTNSSSIVDLPVSSESPENLWTEEPRQTTLTRGKTQYMQSQFNSVYATIELARQSGKPLDATGLTSLIETILVPAPEADRPAFQGDVIHKLDALQDQGSATQHIVQEVWELQKQMNDRLILIQRKTEAILTQNYELLEFTIPRLFIVLPEFSTAWDPATRLRTKFRLHFICECGEHTRENGSVIPHHLHLANHEGYAINKPTEFFEKYGPFLILMLKMLKVGMNVAGIVVPALTTLKLIDVDTVTQSVDSVTTDVIKGVDYSLAYLEYNHTVVPTSNVIGADAKALRDDLVNYFAGVEGLEGMELRQLGSYLATKSSGNLLGNLYRMTTRDGHVKWVCRDHYRSGYQERYTQKLCQVIEVAKGTFDEQLGRIEITLISGAAAEEFYNAVCNTKGIIHLELSMRWRHQHADFVKLKELVSRSNIRALKLDLACKLGHTMDRIRMKNISVRRYDPIFEMMRLPSIQSFEIERAPPDFFERANHMPRDADLSNLRYLRIDGPRNADTSAHQVVGLNQDDAAKLQSLVSRAPNLSKLSLTASLSDLPRVLTSISELQTYPIVFENLMLRVLPPKTQFSKSKMVIRNLDLLFAMYGTQLEVMESSECTIQGIEYDGVDRSAAIKWLQQGKMAPGELCTLDKHLENLSIDLGAGERLRGLAEGEAYAQYTLGTLYYDGKDIPQDYAKALKWLLLAANQEYAEAQFQLGEMYHDGKGVLQNFTKAMEWYLKAAGQDNSRAQVQIGDMYRNGDGVPQNFYKAMEWLLKPASLGNAAAQAQVGSLYDEGNGVEQDFTIAMEWYLMAAHQGHAVAMFHAATMYREGKGVSPNLSKATEMYLKSANAGYPVAQFQLGEMYRNGKGVPQNLSKAMDWYLKSAGQGYAEAQLQVGMMFDDGTGVTQSYSQAMEWYMKAAEQGHPVALVQISSIYGDGNGVQQDYSRAMEWYQHGLQQGYTQCTIGTFTGDGIPSDCSKVLRWFVRAAMQGYPPAQVQMGAMYSRGDMVPKDISKAEEWYLKAAHQGDTAAQNNLGFMYQGNGVPQDYPKAFEWYLKAANQGNAISQYNLGFLYKEGRGTQQDNARAVEWFSKAAEQGQEAALFSLGLMYQDGHGVQQDYNRALRWFLKAAVQGLPDSMGQVASMYSRGLGVPQDSKKAEEWYLKAATLGSAPAQNNLGFMYQGNGAVQDYEKAVEWYFKAANQGHPPSQYNLAFLYAEGKGVPQDYSQALAWNLKAAEQLYPQSMYSLGAMYELGQGVEIDLREAVHWYERAAKEGYDIAQIKLGDMYCSGVGVTKDSDKAIEYYLQAAEQGDAAAQNNLGFQYQSHSTNPDYKKAIEWYMKSANQGDSRAQYNLGFVYGEGKGVPQDYSKAMDWYMKAAAQDHLHAQYCLGAMYENGHGVQQDYTVALHWYLRSANGGLAITQVHLGEMYSEGIGVSQDYEKSMEWYVKAVSQGDAAAQNNMAYMYQGFGAPRDYSKSLQLYRMAADQDYAAAQYNLGYMYERGMGVQQNTAEATKWYEKAASQGHGIAQSQMSKIRLNDRSLYSEP